MELWEDPLLLFRYIYVSRTTDHHKTRSSYIKYVGVSIGIIGLGIGSLLGSAVTEICNRVRFNEREHRIVMAWHSDLMNGEHRTGMVNGHIIRDRKSYLSTYFLHGGTTKCIFHFFCGWRVDGSFLLLPTSNQDSYEANNEEKRTQLQLTLTLTKTLTFTKT